MNTGSFVPEEIILDSDDDNICTTKEEKKLSNKELALKKSQLGKEYYSKGNFEMAKILFSNAIELDSSCARYYSNRAAALMSLNQYENVLTDIDKSITLDPTYLKAHNRKFNYFFFSYDIRKCEDYLIRIKNLDHESYNVALNKINDLKQKKAYLDKALKNENYNEALFYIETILKICPQSIELKLLKAEMLVYLKKYKQVLDIINSTIIKNNYKSEFYYIQGLSLYYEDSLERAIQYFQAALRLEPEHTKAQKICKKAKTFKEMKKEANRCNIENYLDKALELYLKLLEIDPSNTVANSKVYFNISIVYGKKNKLNEAIQNCSKAIELDNDYIKALLRRAKLYNNLEMYEESAKDYKNVCDKKKGAKVFREYYEDAIMRSKNKNYYKILGITESADTNEIKRAYKKRAMDHHPDRHVSLSEEEKKLHEKKFKDVGEAYMTLSDPEKRKNYDSHKHRNKNFSNDFPNFSSHNFGETANLFRNNANFFTFLYTF